MTQRTSSEALLEPSFSTIQPTLFPQTGHSVYNHPKIGVDCLIVESPQSMSNRLEELVLKPNSSRCELIDLFKGLSYVTLYDKTTKNIVASTVTLPNRIGAGYIATHKESDLGKQLISEINCNGLHITLFKYDPFSLIHGTFLSFLDSGKHKVTRALTSGIEAINVVAVPVGGASKDPISASSDKWQLDGYFENEKGITPAKGSALGMGNVPYYLEEYACETIKARFSIDNSLLESYGLPDSATELLKAIAKWKVLKFLASPIRLRTTEYDLGEEKKSGLEESLPDLEKTIPKLIKQCAKKGLFADPIVTKVSITLKEKTASKKPTKSKQKKEEATK